ncbi:DUF547 domain-containing protein, partial [Vibrio sp.]|uniref:DUF547 domain-containing protein n=1 Tax=Vibrio sp. TaxID=678 RepID=UPI003D0A412E
MKRLMTLLMVIFGLPAWSAPQAELWPYWTASDETNSSQINHSDWQTLLDRYRIQSGDNTLFRYSKVTDSDRQLLNQYLTKLTQLDPRQYKRAEQYAYWVNLYNAATVDLILKHYPVSSITKLGGWFSFGPWDDQIAQINGQALTLNDIEHRILRPIWRDPRTHYVVNCASLGCPNLPAKALTANNSETLREQAATAFINSDKGAKLRNAELQLSSIYDWFASDFGNRDQ